MRPTPHHLFTIFSQSVHRLTFTKLDQLANFSAAHHLFTIFSQSFHQLTTCLPTCKQKSKLANFSPTCQIFGSSASVHHLFTNSPTFCQLAKETNSPMPTFRQFTIFLPFFHQLATCLPSFHIFSPTSQIVAFANILQACQISSSLRSVHHLFTNLPNIHQLTICPPTCPLSGISPSFTNLQIVHQPTIVSPSLRKLAKFHKLAIFSQASYQLARCPPAHHLFTNEHVLQPTVCSPSCH